MTCTDSDEEGKVCLGDKEANRPYDGLFKGLGAKNATEEHSHVRVNPDHNKSSVCLGQEPSTSRFAYAEQQRHQVPAHTSFYVEQAAVAAKHIDKNKSSVYFGDDRPLLPPGVNPAKSQTPRTPHATHGKAINSEHNKSTVVFGDATDQDRFEFAEERRGHPVGGKLGQEQLLFAAVAEGTAHRDGVGNRNRRNDSSIVLGTDNDLGKAPRRSLAKEFRFMPSAPETVDEIPRSIYVRNPRAVSEYGNFDQSE
ncbi:hypothetical protein BESB_005200 [Besnoitia besnoiti]|uniref:Uncharacterized protein n=1 Tax=Besnoitia besnoiti TaxID=94643 RepID=A0A2A9MJT9_BESBE|nr:hypothetical protein BESB_005200 [Besnoitia besnoiti]PFH38179.1 hypothetical protein BESB_005200 [Besnoitia besnoiti]